MAIENKPELFQEKLQEEPRDRTKWIWLGIILLVGVMVALLWTGRTPKPIETSVRVKHILISFDAADPVERGRAFEQITELRKRIVDGEDFDALARSLSDDPTSAKRGGDLGWAPRQTYAAPFEEYCWSGEIGAVSNVIQTEFGFHLIKITERHIAEAERYEYELEQRALQELREQNKAQTK